MNDRPDRTELKKKLGELFPPTLVEQYLVAIGEVEAPHFFTKFLQEGPAISLEMVGLRNTRAIVYLLLSPSSVQTSLFPLRSVTGVTLVRHVSGRADMSISLDNGTVISMFSLSESPEAGSLAGFARKLQHALGQGVADGF